MPTRPLHMSQSGIAHNTEQSANLIRLMIMINGWAL
jgi:hypothetical protein